MRVLGLSPGICCLAFRDLGPGPSAIFSRACGFVYPALRAVAIAHWCCNSKPAPLFAAGRSIPLLLRYKTNRRAEQESQQSITGSMYLVPLARPLVCSGCNRDAGYPKRETRVHRRTSQGPSTIATRLTPSAPPTPMAIPGPHATLPMTATAPPKKIGCQANAFFFKPANNQIQSNLGACRCAAHSLRR